MTNKPTNRGFTLVETLLAVLVLSIAIAGPLTIASKGLGAALVAKDQIVASYLAQDAVEYVRFLRDSNRLANTAWLTNLAPCVSADGSAACYLDSLAQNPATPQSCAASTCASLPLYWDATNHRYTYLTSGNTVTIFTRTITITTPIGGSADEAQLTVTVTWTDTRGPTHSLSVQENLFNWQ